MSNNIKYFSDIKYNISDKSELSKYALDYNKLPFFNNWIVGFTVSEKFFFIKSNSDACYQLKHKLNPELFNAFLLKFQTTRIISIDKEKILTIWGKF